MSKKYKVFKKIYIYKKKLDKNTFFKKNIYYFVFY